MIKTCIIALFACLHCSLALAATPSTASLKELLAITESRQLLDSVQNNVRQQVDTVAQNMIADISNKQGKPLSAQQKAVVERYKQKLTALFAAEMNWEKMEPIFLDLYAKTFSQDEVDGMLQFYKSKAGQAVIKKLPALTQNSMAMMQNMLTQMMPKFAQLTEQMATEMKETGKQ